MTISVFALWLPILLSGIALFFASFLSWMVLQLHKNDWRKTSCEDLLLDSLRKENVPVGSYMLPGCTSTAEMNSKEFQEKMERGPRAVMTLMPNTNMGANLLLTFVTFVIISFTLGYLASVAFKAGETFLNVFRFVFTAGLLAFLAAMICHSIWFRNRIVGHIIESVCYAAISAAIFAAMWPKA
jgi:hypothetical protein